MFHLTAEISLFQCSGRWSFIFNFYGCIVRFWGTRGTLPRPLPVLRPCCYRFPGRSGLGHRRLARSRCLAKYCTKRINISWSDFNKWRTSEQPRRVVPDPSESNLLQSNQSRRYIEQLVLARAYTFGAQVQRRMRNMADAIYEVGFNNTDTIFLISAFWCDPIRSVFPPRRY